MEERFCPRTGAWSDRNVRVFSEPLGSPVKTTSGSTTRVVARNVLILVLMGGQTACLLPPNGRDPDLPPYPPSFDFIIPQRPLYELRDDCREFFLGVSGLSDPDSSVLLARWVLNNNLDNTELLQASTLPGDPIGLETTTRIVVDIDLAGLQQGFDTQVISLFVTDGPAWAREESDLVDGSGDLGAGVEDAFVIEVRWAFTLGANGAGECPQ